MNASASRRVCIRNAIKETCAIVNDSIAPNAYISPRNVVCPGSSTTIGISPPKTSSDSHGVLSFGCSRRKTSGSWRYVDIAYVIREAPITPAFVAMKRMVAARMPT